MLTASSTCAMASLWMACLPIKMRTLGRVLYRTVFWSYERGTWPYDVAVGLIVLFVLLAPRGWFHDQPQIGPPPSPAHVELLEDNVTEGTRLYRVDARLVASPVRTPAFNREMHDALRNNVSDLRGRSFQILRYDAIHGEDGTVNFYDVSVKP